MILSRAPCRIPLGGGGTDLPSYYSKYGGFVISAAINKYIYIYVNRPAADDLLRVKYSRYEQVGSVDEIEHDLVRAALKVLNINGSLEIASMADVPAGTGIGTSGTYLVALLVALFELKREKIPLQALAELACHIEMDIAGHPVGKHDHYLAAFGGITCLDIERDGKVHVSSLDVSITTIEELRTSILLFYTGITRSSSEILSQQAADTLRGLPAVIDSLHRTKELGYEIKEALEEGDLDRLGLLMDEHWQNKKLRSDKISRPEIDRWYDVAKSHGALGGKIIGAGGGGFLVLYCPRKKKKAIREALLAEGLREVTYDFEFQPAKVVVDF